MLLLNLLLSHFAAENIDEVDFDLWVVRRFQTVVDAHVDELLSARSDFLPRLNVRAGENREKLPVYDFVQVHVPNQLQLAWVPWRRRVVLIHPALQEIKQIAEMRIFLGDIR